MWQAMAASAIEGVAKGAMSAPSAGPSSAFGESNARTDHSGWSINFGGVQGTSGSGSGGGAGGINPMTLILIAAVGFVLWKKLK